MRSTYDEVIYVEGADGTVSSYGVYYPEGQREHRAAWWQRLWQRTFGRLLRFRAKRGSTPPAARGVDVAAKPDAQAPVGSPGQEFKP